MLKKVYYASDKVDNVVRYIGLQGEKLMLKFRGAKYIGEYTPTNFGMLKEVDIVSILETENGVEVCEHINREMRIKKGEKSKLDEIKKYYEGVKRRKYIHIREGVEGGIAYKQTLYVYMRL